MTSSRVPGAAPRLLIAAGVIIMAVASAWAPPQPELLASGACEIAPCGTLEDPARWRAAWWLWSLGAIAVVAGSVLVVQPRRLRLPAVALVVLATPVWVVISGIVAVVVALFTSVQGAATVATVFLLAPALALVGGLGKRHRATRVRRARSPSP